MSSMEETLQAACRSGEIAGAVLVAMNKSESFNYARSFGSLSMKDTTSNPPMELETVMRIASCTKLLTSIAAMQCVERGLVDLDANVSLLLPELDDLQILRDFDANGKPVLEMRREKITLRRLLTHSSGLGYDYTSPLLAKWRRYSGQKVNPAGDTIMECYFTPLLFEPGSAWMYGPSIDWAGKLVERATGISLEAYMQEHIFRPLGIKDMTFFLQSRPDMIARRAEISLRDATTGGLTYVDDELWHKDPVEAFGGRGLFATPREFLKVLHSLLANDGKLLSSSSLDYLFQPHLDEAARQKMHVTLKDPNYRLFLSLMPVDLKKDYGLGGILLMEDNNVPNWRTKGSMSWAGAFHTNWFIDREVGLCGLFATQIRPYVDKKTLELVLLFEKTMYQRLADSK